MEKKVEPLSSDNLNKSELVKVVFPPQMIGSGAKKFVL